MQSLNLEVILQQNEKYGYYWDDEQECRVYGVIGLDEQWVFQADENPEMYQKQLEECLIPGNIADIAQKLTLIGAFKRMNTTDPRVSKEMFITIAKMLSDFGEGVIELAFDEFLRTNKSDWFPQPAVLVDICKRWENIVLIALGKRDLPDTKPKDSKELEKEKRYGKPTDLNDVVQKMLTGMKS